MLRKVALGIAFMAALMVPLSAFAAKGQSGRVRSVGRSSGHMHMQMRRSVVKTTHVRVRTSTHVVKMRGHDGRHHYNHRRHFWHGQWWAYGVGSCWTYDPAYDEYYWVCGDE